MQGGYGPVKVMEYPNSMVSPSLNVWNIPSPDPVEWDSRQLVRVSMSTMFWSSSLEKQGQSSTTAFANPISASDAMILKEVILFFGGWMRLQ
jgi:hypothetical protein